MNNLVDCFMWEQPALVCWLVRSFVVSEASKIECNLNLNVGYYVV